MTPERERGTVDSEAATVAAAPAISYVAWKRWAQERFGEYTPSDAVYFAAELATAGLPDLAGRRVLEIGYGNGAFGAWAISRGAHYAGIEIEDELIARGAAVGWRVARSLEELDASGWSAGVDLVAAFDVFEHIDAAQLPELLAACLARLAPGGLLLARVPSGDSPFGRAIQHGDPTHRVVLGSHRVRHLAASLGCELRQLREPALPLRGLGTRTFLRRALARLVKAIVHPVVARVLMDDAGAIVSPNLVFVMAVPDIGRRVGG
jgi:SAM-dependent methyltransferase